MRFLLLTLSAAWMMPLSTSAQAQFIDFWGARVGTNMSDLSTTVGEFDSRWGAQVGVFVEFRMEETLSVLAEVEYARRGYGFLVQEWDEIQQVVLDQVRGTTLTHYLSFPLLGRLVIDRLSEVAPYVSLGPRFDFLIGSNPAIVTMGDETFEDTLIQHFKTFGVTATIGVGLALREIMGNEVRIDGRYNIGVTDQLPTEIRGQAQPQSFDISIVIAL